MTTPITQDALYAEWQKYLGSAEPSGAGLTTSEIVSLLSEGRPAVGRGRVDTFIREMVDSGKATVTTKRVRTRIGRLSTVPSYVFAPADPPVKKEKKRGAT